MAENAAGAHTAQFEISVHEQAPASWVTVDISPTGYTGRSGETVTFRCIGDRATSDIKWSRENALLPYSSREDNAVLTIYNSKPEDSGTYVCTVRTRDGAVGYKSAIATIRSSSIEGYQYI